MAKSKVVRFSCIGRVEPRDYREILPAGELILASRDPKTKAAYNHFRAQWGFGDEYRITWTRIPRRARHEK